jgi:hypothetical protein
MYNDYIFVALPDRAILFLSACLNSPGIGLDRQAGICRGIVVSARTFRFVFVLTLKIWTELPLPSP